MARVQTRSGKEYRVERSNTPNGWSFLVSDSELTYLHVDNTYHVKEMLDGVIIDWIEDYEKKQKLTT